MSEFCKFIVTLDEWGWGILSMNTYTHDEIFYVYLCLARKGDKGIFLKVEFEARMIDDVLNGLLHRIATLETLAREISLDEEVFEKE